MVATAYSGNQSSMSRMTTLKRVTVSQETIDSLARGCPWNNPITVALKEQAFPEAREILIHGNDEIYVDGLLVVPTIQLTRFINDWNAGRKVVPMILGFYVP